MGYDTNKRAKKFGKIGIAKADRIQVVIDGVYEDDRQKFISVATSLGINFDPLTNTVTTNNTNNRLDALEVDTHVHANLATLDSLTSTYITNLENTIALLETKLANLSSVFGVSFDAAGAVTSETYSTHTHDFVDTTIADTADGTGVSTDTTKITQGVN